MTPTEATRLVRLVRAVCPAQQIDEHSPEVWAELLSEVRVADAVEAVKRLGRRQPFIAPSEVIDTVRVIRNERLERFDERDWTPPAEVADDPRRYVEWIRAARAAVADGEQPPVAAVGCRAMPAVERVFREVPSV